MVDDIFSPSDSFAFDSIFIDRIMLRVLLLVFRLKESFGLLRIVRVY